MSKDVEIKALYLLEVIKMQVTTLICDILIVLISGFAILKYIFNQKQKLKSAATIVYNQLKEFDEFVETVKGKFDQNGNLSDYNLMLTNDVVGTNAWSLNKHILINSLSQDDVELINKAYSDMESIADARKRVLDTFMTTNNAKSFALQMQVINMIAENNNVDAIQNLSKEFNDLKISFSMKLPHDIFKNMVCNYKKMSGTQALERLRELSYKNKK